MSSSFALYDQNVSLIQDSGRIVVTCAKSPTGICLVIDRKTAKISSQTAVQADVLKPGLKKKTIYGVLGILDGSLLIVVTRRVRQGEVCGKTIWRVDAVEVIPILRNAGGDDGGPLDEDLAWLTQCVTEVMSTPYFYFSYNSDLTQTQQRLSTSKNLSKPLLERADTRFVWNHHLLSGLATHADLLPFLVPVIHGAVFIKKCTINGKSFVWTIISRRSRHRVGARLFSRGCNDKGEVSNYVETEQLVEYGTAVSSFVQTRGSMPMFWQQWPNIKYKPRPTMTLRQEDSVSAFQKHFQEQIPLYGEQVIVNLVDQKKAEGELELNLRNLCEGSGVKEISYIGFDFHKECAKMRYDKLSILIGKCRGQLSDFGYFFNPGSSSSDPAAADAAVQFQKGVFRTNCVDCLDRTNVVQSLLATENLKDVLKRMSILSPVDDIMRQNLFQKTYKNTWADHADMISVQYSGTGALKTDFTRTGVRSKWGLLQDGWNSANRYYFNNFRDGDRTDAQRVFVGEIAAQAALRAHTSATKRGKGALGYLPAALLVTLLILAFSLITCNEVSVQFFLVILASAGATFGLGKLILANGYHLVNAPATMKRLT